MDLFVDLFGLRRRRIPRVAVRWLVDARIYGTDQFIGLYTRDVSLGGLRLEGCPAATFRRLLSPAGRAQMRLRLPHISKPLTVEVELRWSLGDPPSTGWSFTRIAPKARRLLAEYIASHPADLLS